MKKIFPFLIFFLILLAVGAVIYFTSYQDKKFSVEDKLIAVPPHEIDRVQLVEGADTVVLEEKDGRWFMGTGAPALKIRVTALLNALGRFEFLGQLPPYQADSLGPELQKEGMQVFLDKNGKARNKYFLYRPAVTSPVLMSSMGEELVYAIYMPGEEKALEKYFQVDKMYWRDKTILSFMPGEIKAMELRYPVRPDQSFRIKHSSNTVELFLLDSEKEEKVNSADQLALKRYLSYFANVDFYRLANGRSRDSLQKAQAWARLKIWSREDNVLSLNLYQIPADRDKQERDSYTYDVNECYGMIHGINEIYRIKYVEIDPLLKKPEYFIKL